MTHRRRAVAAGAVIVALIAGLGVLPWFSADLATFAGSAALHVKLRSVEGCAMGVCQQMAMSKLSGSYPTAAGLTFWFGAAFVLALAAQTFTALTAGAPHPLASRAATITGLVTLLAGFCALFLFGPDTGAGSAEGVSVHIARDLGGWLTLGGVVAGLVVASMTATEDLAATPSAAVPHAQARYATLGAPAPAEIAPPAPTAPTAGDAAPTGPRYAAMIAALSHHGLDARRVDGPRQIAWADVVGVIVRALPDGAPFVDVVSTPGATVRLGPWTELSGALVPGYDPADPRAAARALAAHVHGHAPAATLDRATAAFVAGELAEPPSLPDAAALAAYDDRLA